MLQPRPSHLKSLQLCTQSQMQRVLAGVSEKINKPGPVVSFKVQCNRLARQHKGCPPKYFCKTAPTFHKWMLFSSSYTTTWFERLCILIFVFGVFLWGKRVQFLWGIILHSQRENWIVMQYSEARKLQARYRQGFSYLYAKQTFVHYNWSVQINS